MTLRTILVGLALVLLVPASVAAQIPQEVVLVIDPASIDTTLGQTERVTVTATNSSDGPIGPIAVHLDITDPLSESSVDPEDWTSTLTQEIELLEPGRSEAVIWNVQPISNGTFSMYAVALASGSADVTVSNAVTVRVESRRTMNPEGILPVAIASPLVVGVLLILNVRRASSLKRVRRST